MRKGRDYGLFYCGVRGDAGRVLGRVGSSAGRPLPAMPKAAMVRLCQSMLIFGVDGRRVELRPIRNGEGR